MHLEEYHVPGLVGDGKRNTQAPQYSCSGCPRAILTSMQMVVLSRGAFSPQQHLICAIEPEGINEWVLSVVNRWPSLRPLLTYCFFQVWAQALSMSKSSWNKG